MTREEVSYRRVVRAYASLMEAIHSEALADRRHKRELARHDKAFRPRKAHK